MPDRSIDELTEVVGERRRSVTGLTVEAGKVSEFARAIGDESPLYHDPGAGSSENRPAPLTFTRTSYFPRYRPPGVGDWFGFDLGFHDEAVLHGQQEYRYERPVEVGDTLSATTTLADVYQRDGSGTDPMTFCVFVTEFTDQSNELVVTSRTTRIEVPPPTVTDATPDDGTDSTGGPDGETAVRRNLTGPGGIDPDRTHLFEDVSRADFVRYAGASGDFNPVHFDEPYATEHGHPSVFGQGMLTAGYASTLLTDWLGPRSVDRFATRFEARVWPGDTLVACGAVTDDADDGTPLEVDLWVTRPRGETVVTGSVTADPPES